MKNQFFWMKFEFHKGFFMSLRLLGARMLPKISMKFLSLQASIETSIDEIASIEGSSEALRSWEVFCWEIFLLWLLWAVWLIGSLIDEIFLKSLLWVFNFVSIGWELPWDHILTLNLCIIVFNSSINLGVELTMLPHFFQSFVLECSHRVFECKITIAL